MTAVKEAVKAEFQKRKEQLDKAREEQIKFNLEKMAAESKYKPTPTPEELNAARAGLNVDNKEPDGSPEQDEFGRAKMAGAEGSAAYRTRQVQAGQPHQVNKGEPPKKE